MGQSDSSSSEKAASKTSTSLYTTPGNLNTTAQPAQTTHSIIGSASSPLGAEQIGAMATWLAVIIGFIVIGAYLYKRMTGYRGQSGDAIHIVASRSLGQRERIVVTDVAGKRLVLGVTSQSVTRLHTTSPPAEESDSNSSTADDQPPTFAQALATNLRLMRTRSNRERNGQ